MACYGVTVNCTSFGTGKIMVLKFSDPTTIIFLNLNTCKVIHKLNYIQLICLSIYEK